MDAAAGGALVLVALNLILALVEGRNATRPQRERDQAERELADDLAEMGDALARKDADAIARKFEEERLRRWRDMGRNGGAPRPDGPPDAGGLRPDRPADPR